jgi:hypothetical protein
VKPSINIFLILAAFFSVFTKQFWKQFQTFSLILLAKNGNGLINILLLQNGDSFIIKDSNGELQKPVQEEYFLIKRH